MEGALLTTPWPVGSSFFVFGIGDDWSSFSLLAPCTLHRSFSSSNPPPSVPCLDARLEARGSGHFHILRPPFPFYTFHSLGQSSAELSLLHIPLLVKPQPIPKQNTAPRKRPHLVLLKSAVDAKSGVSHRRPLSRCQLKSRRHYLVTYTSVVSTARILRLP